MKDQISLNLSEEASNAIALSNHLKSISRELSNLESSNSPFIALYGKVLSFVEHQEREIARLTAIVEATTSGARKARTERATIVKPTSKNTQGKKKTKVGVKKPSVLAKTNSKSAVAVKRLAKLSGTTAPTKPTKAKPPVKKAVVKHPKKPSAPVRASKTAPKTKVAKK